MRLGLCTMLGLVGILLAVPLPANAGNYGCQSGYYNPGYGVRSYSYYPTSYATTYYPTSYYQPTYNYVPAAPAYVTPPPNTCVDTPNGQVCNHGYGAGSTGLGGGYGADYRNDVLYRIAPDLANARLAQEAADATIGKFKAELARQQAENEARADRQANRDFQQSVIQILQNNRQVGSPGTYSQPPPAQMGPVQMTVPPELIQAIQQLQADSAQFRAYIEQGSKRMVESPAIPSPPAIPPAGGPPNPKANSGPAEAAKKGVADKQHGCLECHYTGNPKKLTDLTDPSKLYYEKAIDCINRMISSDPEFVMPKGKKPGTAPAELVGAFHDLSRTAQHDPRLK